MVDQVTVTPLPPVPSLQPPLQDVKNGREAPNNFAFNVPWTQWFVQVREKINVINSILVAFSQVIGGGLVVSDGTGTATTRTIQGTTGEIGVADGDGIAGDPTISLVATGITPGKYQGLDIDVDGRIVGVNITYIVSGLPTPVVGAKAFVTDATLTIILGLGTVVVGSGGNKVPVYSDGTNWLIG